MKVYFFLSWVFIFSAYQFFYWFTVSKVLIKYNSLDEYRAYKNGHYVKIMKKVILDNKNKPLVEDMRRLLKIERVITIILIIGIILIIFL